MSPQERALLTRLLTDRIRWLRAQIRAQDLLSEPVTPGRWRWADVKTGGYGRKSDEELAADREQARARAAEARRELAIATSAARKLLSAEWL